MENNENSGVNTVLIVIVLVIVVGAVVWFLAGRGPATTPDVPAPTNNDNDSGLNVDLNFPGGDNGTNTNATN